MEEYIENLIRTACNTIPVIPEPTPDGIYPCITFHFYNERGELFGSGTATEETVSCQIDIWSETKNKEIKQAIKNIKTAIKNERNFAYPTKESTYEVDNKIFHTYFLFDLIIESEE